MNIMKEEKEEKPGCSDIVFKKIFKLEIDRYNYQYIYISDTIDKLRMTRLFHAIDSLFLSYYEFFQKQEKVSNYHRI